jgi:hypothetical protein
MSVVCSGACSHPRADSHGAGGPAYAGAVRPGRRPYATGGAAARISSSSRAVKSAGVSLAARPPPVGWKKRTRSRARLGKRTRSTVPSTAQHTICASGTACASRPNPLRARSGRPPVRVPSRNMPMQEPARSSEVARSRAPTSPMPRPMGICPIPSRTFASSAFFHSDDFASAWIWRRSTAAIPITTGSHHESWLPASSVGPERGRCSRPVTSRRPHPRTTGEAAVITTRKGVATWEGISGILSMMGSGYTGRSRVRGSRSVSPECLALFGADCSAPGSDVCRTSEHGPMVVTSSLLASADSRANQGIGSGPHRGDKLAQHARC